MSKIGYCIACALLFVNAFAEPLEAQEIKSPDGELFLKVNVDDNGQPVYSLKYKGNPLVNKSHLGLSGKEADFVKGFAVQHVDSTTFDEVWEPVWGEYSKVRNHYNEMSVTFSKKYCIPGDYDTDEYLYVKAPMSKTGDPIRKRKGRHSESQAIGGLSVQTPLLMKSPDGKQYVNIHEAALIGYPAMALDVDTCTYSLSAHLTPDRNGVAAYLQLPFNTPWRTIIVSDDARDILASQLIYNLNEPCTEIHWCMVGNVYRDTSHVGI